MPDTGFVVPELATVIDRVKGDLNSRMGNQNAFIRRSLPWALAHVIAAAVWGLYLYQKWISRQVIIDTADDAQMARWARIFGILRTEATYATGIVEVGGVLGSTISNGEILQRDDQATYVVSGGPYTCPAPPAVVDVTVTAEESGDDGNWDTGNALQFVSPPAGVVAEATVKTPGIAGGVDEESDEDLLERLLQRIQNPPQGGSEADYEAWTRAAGVDADIVWVFGFPNLFLGYVEVYFIIDATTSPADLSMIPSAPTVAIVQAYIEDRERKPVGMDVTVTGAISDPMGISITVTKDADNPYTDGEIKDAIQIEIEGMFRDYAELVLVGTSSVPNSRLMEAIGEAAGSDVFEVTDINGDGTGDSDVTFAALKYPTVVQGVGDLDITIV